MNEKMKSLLIALEMQRFASLAVRPYPQHQISLILLFMPADLHRSYVHILRPIVNRACQLYYYFSFFLPYCYDDLSKTYLMQLITCAISMFFVQSLCQNLKKYFYWSQNIIQWSPTRNPKLECCTTITHFPAQRCRIFVKKNQIKTWNM